MKPTHWKVTISRPDGWKATGRNKPSWGVPAQIRHVFTGHDNSCTRLHTREKSVKNWEADAAKYGLDCLVVPCVLTPLTTEQLMEADVAVPVSDEWRVLVDRYGTDWWGTK